MPADKIVFGIVTSTYNRKELLHRALQSLQSQSYVNWIVCVVDDASTDGTDTYMQQYADNKKVHYIRHLENSGSNVVRNRALDYLLDERHCDYIAFLDDDDYFTPKALEKAAEMIEKHPQYKWFVSNSVYPDGKKVTQIKNYKPMNYIDNLVGDGFTGDATGFHAAEIIGDIRFTTHNNIRAREWHFLIQQAAKSDMFLYDFNSQVHEYMVGGQTLNQYKESKEERKACREYENKLLKELGFSFEELEYRKAKNRYENLPPESSFIKRFRAKLRVLKWKVRKLWASL